jgi:cytochrome c oxidase cbb3-type subunit III
MTDKRIDQATGTETVGHEWDGIEELNTPLPRWWLWTFYITIVWSAAFVIAYPAWPMISGATQGMLGWTSRGQLAQEMSAAEQARASVREQLSLVAIERLPENPALMAQAVAGGSAAFKVNCVQCHGSGASGSEGYPNLADDDWLWGGDLKAIETTLLNGIRAADHPETRVSTMPAFAGAIEGARLNALVAHVQSLDGTGQGNAAGAQTYAENCALCHGASGEGSRALGAPSLKDAIWLYGDGREAITQQILSPRLGQMPAWGGRLDPVTIRMLAAYVHSLGGGEEFVEVAAEPAAEAQPQP